MLDQLRTLIATAVFAAAVSLSSTTEASDVRLQGPVTWSCFGGAGVITANRVSNYDLFGYSGTLLLELWAFPSPFTGNLSIGFKLAQFSLDQLNAGYYLSGITSGTIPCFPPPNGTWYVAVILTEYTGTFIDNGYQFRDYINTTPPWVVGAPPPPPPPPPLTIE